MSIFSIRDISLINAQINHIFMTLSSGRTITVLIFSTSIMKEIYLAPIEYYDPNMIIVLRSNRKDDISQLENEIYDSVKDQIPCNKITEYYVDTHDFDDMMGTLLEVKKKLRSSIKDRLEIFINISSGTNEYAAAGTLVAMTNPVDIVFNVMIEDSGLDKDELKEMFTEREHVISDPSIMTQIDKADPDEKFVALLSVLEEMHRTSIYTPYPKIVQALKECGGWYHNIDAKSGNKSTPLEQREKENLIRRYIEIAEENGWIKRREGSRQVIDILPKGKAYLEVCREKEMPELMCCNAMTYYESTTFDMAPVRKKRKAKDALIVEHNGKSYRFTLSVR